MRNYIKCNEDHVSLDCYVLKWFSDVGFYDFLMLNIYFLIENNVIDMTVMSHVIFSLVIISIKFDL